MKGREAFFGGFFVGLDGVKIDDGGDFSFSQIGQLFRHTEQSHFLLSFVLFLFGQQVRERKTFGFLFFVALQICCFVLFVGNEHEKLSLLLNLSFDCFEPLLLRVLDHFLLSLMDRHYILWLRGHWVWQKNAFYITLIKFWHLFYLKRAVDHHLPFLSFYDA